MEKIEKMLKSEKDDVALQIRILAVVIPGQARDPENKKGGCMLRNRPGKLLIPKRRGAHG
jgi:hypothetical protein